MSANRRMFWKVLAIPAWVIWWRLRRRICWPANRTVPSVGRKTPVTTLNTVVLPAPLGPMRAKIWPG